MIVLAKGENTKLDINVFHVGLGWDVKEDETSNEDFDLDVSAFMINVNKKIPADEYFVFYNSENRLKVYLKGDHKGELVQPINIVNGPKEYGALNDAMRSQSRPVDPEISVIGSIDNIDGEGNNDVSSDDNDDETMDIDLTKVRSDINDIVICVSIHDYEERRQNFGQVENAYIRIYKSGQTMGQEDYRYDLSEDFSTCTSIEFCRLYRHNGEWKIQALGIGHKGGLQELVNKYV